MRSTSTLFVWLLRPSLQASEPRYYMLAKCVAPVEWGELQLLVFKFTANDLAHAIELGSIDIPVQRISVRLYYA
jgi:hypothetical protein